MDTLSRRGNKERAAAVVSKDYTGVAHLKDYKIINKLGEGTFGIVYKGLRKKNDCYVAIKRILQRDIEDTFPVTAYREFVVLRALHDDHIIELIECIHDKPESADLGCQYTSKMGKSVFLVFPYMSYDLTGILQNPDISLLEEDNKSIMVQMLRGLDYMHQQGYLHRDIKASNILINSEGLLKIGDFGLARRYSGHHPTLTSPGGGIKDMTEVVMTRWYRAPEVLMGNRKYTTAVDLWACGCILGELYEKKPILPGKSDLEQAYDVFNLVGEPNSRTMPGFEYLKLTPKLRIEPRQSSIRQRFGSLMGATAISLLENLLVLDHMKRYTASKALEHEWLTTEAPLPTETVKTDFPETHESDVVGKRKPDAVVTNKSNAYPVHSGGNTLPPNTGTTQPQKNGPSHNLPPGFAPGPPESSFANFPSRHQQTHLHPPPQSVPSLSAPIEKDATSSTTPGPVTSQSSVIPSHPASYSENRYHDQQNHRYHHQSQQHTQNRFGYNDRNNRQSQGQNQNQPRWGRPGNYQQRPYTHRSGGYQGAGNNNNGYGSGTRPYNNIGDVQNSNPHKRQDYGQDRASNRYYSRGLDQQNLKHKPKESDDPAY